MEHVGFPSNKLNHVKDPLTANLKIRRDTMSIANNGGLIGGRCGTLGRIGTLGDCGIGGIGEFGGVAGKSFFTLLFSLWQQRVRVLTEGDVGAVEGILTDINPTFITVVGAHINYIPICQITIIARTCV